MKGLTCFSTDRVLLCLGAVWPFWRAVSVPPLTWHRRSCRRWLCTTTSMCSHGTTLCSTCLMQLVSAPVPLIARGCKWSYAFCCRENQSLCYLCISSAIDLRGCIRQSNKNIALLVNLVWLCSKWVTFPDNWWEFAWCLNGLMNFLSSLWNFILCWAEYWHH